jgi:hypothetical protein
MMDFNNPGSPDIPAPTPVPRSSQTFANINVQIYSDPRMASTSTPVLYAECEEYDTWPLSPSTQRRNLSPRSPRSPASPGSARPLHSAQGSPREARSNKSAAASEYEIKWANTQAKQSLEYMTKQLYPRLLYAFSDVVVIVLRDSR